MSPGPSELNRQHSVKEIFATAEECRNIMNQIENTMVPSAQRALEALGLVWGANITELLLHFRSPASEFPDLIYPIVTLPEPIGDLPKQLVLTGPDFQDAYPVSQNPDGTYAITWSDDPNFNRVPARQYSPVPSGTPFIVHQLLPNPSHVYRLEKFQDNIARILGQEQNPLERYPHVTYKKQAAEMLLQAVTTAATATESWLQPEYSLNNMAAQIEADKAHETQALAAAAKLLTEASPDDRAELVLGREPNGILLQLSPNDQQLQYIHPLFRSDAADPRFPDAQYFAAAGTGFHDLFPVLTVETDSPTRSSYYIPWTDNSGQNLAVKSSPDMLANMRRPTNVIILLDKETKLEQVLEATAAYVAAGLPSQSPVPGLNRSHKDSLAAGQVLQAVRQASGTLPPETE